MSNTIEVTTEGNNIIAATLLAGPTVAVSTQGGTTIDVTPEGDVTVGVEYNPVASSSPNTNIGITRTNAAVTVTSSTGDDGTILAADASNAGVFTAANFTKLAAITGTNTGDQNLSPLMVKANNLSDLTSASTARTNLGLGTLATQSGTFSGTSSGTNTGDQSIFKNIAVAGQSTVVADTTNDTLTLVAGTNITLTTDALTDTVTITASNSGGDVVGPASATNGAFALFDTTTGKLLKNGSVPGGAATLNVGTSAGTVAAGDDSRLTNARTPTAHAATHVTGGTDAIPSATSAQDGLATSTQITKLDGIEAGADVTDATNVSAAGAVMKTLVDAKGDLLVATAADTVTRLPIGVSNGQVLTVDSAETTGVKWVTPASSGDVLGPASSTDNAFARFDSTTGKLLQNSTATLNDVGLASLDGVQFSATPTSTVGTAKAVWDTTDSCLSVGLNALVNALVGVDSHVQVYNDSASTMTVMQVVRQSGSSGTRLKVALALANTDATSATTIGIVAQSIASNSQGFIQTAGLLRGVNTNAFNEGDVLWLSSTTAGLITNVKPTAPNHGVRIGYCIKKAGGAGIILIDILNGFELDELHDVKITAPITDKSFLSYDTASSVWINSTDVPASQLTGTLDLARFPANITGRTSFGAENGTRSSSLGSYNLSFTDSDSGRLVNIEPPTAGSEIYLILPSSSGVLLSSASSLPAANLTGTINTARLPATITGLTSVTSTTFVGALTGTASGNLVAGGALGTPSSATLTNATGLPAAGVVGTALTLGGGALTGASTVTLPALATTTTPAWSLINSTAATVGVQVQVSPALIFEGQGWKTTATAASQSVRFRQSVLPVAGTTAPSGIMLFQSDINGANTWTNRLGIGYGSTVNGIYTEIGGGIFFAGIGAGNQNNVGISGNGIAQLNLHCNASITHSIINNASQGLLQAGNAGGFAWSSTATAGGAADTILRRATGLPATVQLGIDSASTTINQTIKAHNVTTGTGADLILKGGTGSSANGNVRFGTHSAWAAEIISGYITIKDESGTLRKLAVIS